MGSWSIWHWIVVLIIVMLVFGTKKLRNIGSDLGSAVRGFKEGMKDAAEDDASAEDKPQQSSTKELGGRTIDGEVKDKQQA